MPIFHLDKSSYKVQHPYALIFARPVPLIMGALATPEYPKYSIFQLPNMPLFPLPHPANMPESPEEHRDMGSRHFKYAIAPHHGGCTEAAVTEEC
jgi:hypothetical protein